VKYVAVPLVVGLVVLQSLATPTAAAETDLDAFMQQVLARRDDNWKKLQQYILDEREQLEVRGPSHVSLWGERRDYTWYVRDGFFIKSPLKVNGVTVPEPDRRKFENDYLERLKKRESRRDRPDNTSDASAPPAVDVATFIRQGRQPEFISSAYVLRFKFDAGTYALVGREQFEGREVLRIEYYPTKLFSPREGRDRRAAQDKREGGQQRPGQDSRDARQDAVFNRLMNKVALVTMWIEPTSHQIVKYTYDNVALDFLPAQWLVHVNDISASMIMAQPFPDVWLPRNLEMNAAVTLAIGEVSLRVALDYHDYRQADATIRVR
jgi:hypothetical protein